MKTPDLTDFVATATPEQRQSLKDQFTAPPPLGIPVENVEIAELSPEERAALEIVSANSTNSTAPPTREHPIPEDSILATYRDFARGVTEAPDCWSVAVVLALCGKLLTPGVHIEFAGRKPLNLFHFIVGPAGMRKSTTFAPAYTLAKRLLKPEYLIGGDASESALFDSFEQQPHRLHLEDEANTTLKAWANTHYGKQVASRYLKLYDGAA